MKKIITIVSPFSRGVSPNSTPLSYQSGNLGLKENIEGILTNEAPIRALLKLHTDIEEIIAIASKTVREQPPVASDGKTVLLDENGEPLPTAYQYLERTIRNEFPNVRFNPIESKDEMDFDGFILPEVLKRVDSHGNDKIFLETTGGPRNAVSDLMQLSQVLTFQGTSVEQAVYSNFHAKTKKLEDVTKSYRTYGLISGLNELQRYGTVNTLQEYFGSRRSQPRELKNLLDAAEDVFNSLSMCRIAQLEGNMTRFQTCLDAAMHSKEVENKSPLLHELLPIFKDKFPSLQNTYHQIQWCLDNNLLQQAVTIFNDRLPKYLIAEKQIITIDPVHLAHAQFAIASKKVAAAEQRLIEAQRTEREARQMASSTLNGAQNNLRSCQDKLNTARQKKQAAQQALEHVRDRDWTSEEIRSGFLDWANNVAASSPTVKKKNTKISAVSKPNSINYDRNPEYEQQKFLLFLSQKDHLLPKNQDAMMTSVDNLAITLRNTPYKLNPRLEVNQLKPILRDLVFVQTLRNQINHASEEGVKDTTRLAALRNWGYPTQGLYNGDVEDLDLRKVKRKLKEAMNHVDKLIELTGQQP